MEMQRLNAMRDRLMIDAFSALESHHKQLAEMLILHVGGRTKAARWMCAHQKVFEGRTAYDMVSDGDMEAIWDEITNTFG